MRVALVVVSIVAVLAIGALAAVLVTGWSINDEEVIADAQATWCWTHGDQLVVSANVLEIRKSSAAGEWGRWLAISEVVTDFTGSLDDLGDAYNAAKNEFAVWLDPRRREGADHIPWVEIVNEDQEFRRACLAAWGAAFGTTPRDSD